jgi:hypothetical protein
MFPTTRLLVVAVVDAVVREAAQRPHRSHIIAS